MPGPVQGSMRFIFLHVHICVQMCAGVGMGRSTHICVCGSRFSQLHLIHWGRISHLNSALNDWLIWLLSLLLGEGFLHLLCLLSIMNTGELPWVPNNYVGSGDPSLGLHACILPTNLFLQSCWDIFFFKDYLRFFLEDVRVRGQKNRWTNNSKDSQP